MACHLFATICPESCLEGVHSCHSVKTLKFQHTVVLWRIRCLKPESSDLYGHLASVWQRFQKWKCLSVYDPTVSYPPCHYSCPKTWLDVICHGKMNPCNLYRSPWSHQQKVRKSHFWPMAFTFELICNIVKGNVHAEFYVGVSNGSVMRVLTDGQTDGTLRGGEQQNLVK